MIIVEGPDGGGKTVLLKQLEVHFDLPVAERVVSKEAEPMVNLQDWVEYNVKQGFQPMLFDRHRLISEAIYGPILRSEAQPGFDDPDWMIEMMTRFYGSKPIIVYCIPSLDTVIDNIKNDPDNLVVRGHIKQIYSAYCARAALDFQVSKTVYDYDYEHDPLDMLFGAISMRLASQVGVG